MITPRQRLHIIFLGHIHRSAGGNQFPPLDAPRKLTVHLGLNMCLMLCCPTHGPKKALFKEARLAKFRCDLWSQNAPDSNCCSCPYIVYPFYHLIQWPKFGMPFKTAMAVESERPPEEQPPLKSPTSDHLSRATTEQHLDREICTRVFSHPCLFLWHICK